MATPFSLCPPLISFLSPTSHSSRQPLKPSLPFSSFPILLSTYHSKKTIFCPSPTHKTSQKSTPNLRISATSGEVLPSDTPIEKTQQIVSSDDASGSTIISALLFFAFVGLSILTVGVIYIAVTDFLQKREREKFEKEETAKKKKSGKKGKVKARAGPRGFGQKIEEDDD
ncbi:uncharacterized protein LOC131252836 [Magnolia sinica]|uniref:uncharacterized protein LOC131252836 n=1 Tax=Magnolia sinica TaxID=86752 RepID=UPI00265B2737|nr:uncharacterized protein LOC131252836 [Magnolia sinica]XP_058109561.1 uncharacterized protein LOC131252836 [Magnolia sinica]